MLLQTSAWAATPGFVEDFDADNGGFSAAFGQQLFTAPEPAAGMLACAALAALALTKRAKRRR